MLTVLVFQLFSESASKHFKTEIGVGGQIKTALQRGSYGLFCFGLPGLLGQECDLCKSISL